MTEETFVRELERRAERVEVAPLTFDTVHDRAVRIRRRRRVGVGVAAAVAVAAVAAPFALGGGTGESAPDPAPAPAGRGAAVLHDRALTLPDGRTVDLSVDNADVSQLGVLTDGRIVLVRGDEARIRVLGADGTPLADYPAETNAITMSARDDAVAWLGPDGTIQLLRAGSVEPVALGRAELSPEVYPTIDAVLDDRVLVGDGTVTTSEYGVDGFREITTSEPLRVRDVSPDGSLWAVQYADDADPQYGCAGLYDPAAHEMVARSCDTFLLGFSPDGQHLLGGFFDNNMAGDVAAYDLDLDEVATFVERDGGVVADAAWADPTHVLVAGADFSANTWELTRVALDGAGTVVEPVQPGGNPELVDEFLFSE